jgi:uncharacterized membrane protein
LPGGDVISYAYGISDDGTVIAGESFSAISAVHGEGVRWTRTAPGLWEMTGIGLPAADALNSPASGASSDGEWIVGRVSYTAPTNPPIDTDAFRWRPSSGFEMLGVPAGYAIAAAVGADKHAHVIVGYGGPNPNYTDTRALAWTRSSPGWQIETLEPLYESQAVRVDPVGKLVIGWGASPAVGPGGREAVYWTRGPGGVWQRHWLGALPETDFFSQAAAVARVGSRHVIVGYSGDVFAFENIQPVLWRVKGAQLLQMAALPLPGGFTDGSASAISEDGSRIVGNCWNDDFEFEVCVWNGAPGSGAYTVATLKDLLMAEGVSSAVDWFLWAASGVSADGSVICGYGSNPDFNDEAWAAELP